jgi:hypothetical protein
MERIVVARNFAVEAHVLRSEVERPLGFLPDFQRHRVSPRRPGRVVANDVRLQVNEYTDRSATTIASSTAPRGARCPCPTISTVRFAPSIAT